MVLVADCLHLLDIASDGNLAKNMYDFSRPGKTNSDVGSDITKHDYNICFVLVCLIICGPFLI